MAKSEMPYWGYDDNPTTVPYVNKSASEWASLTQFVLFYVYMGLLAFAYFEPITAIVNIVCIAFLHWCGVEDLLYFLLSNIIKLPKEYLDTHPQILGIPKSLYWLSEPRKIWFVTIPSIIGFVCGKDVPRWKFLILTIIATTIIIILSIYT
jgi:hypothetical protein